MSTVNFFGHTVIHELLGNYCPITVELLHNLNYCRITVELLLTRTTNYIIYLFAAMQPGVYRGSARKGHQEVIEEVSCTI